MKLEKAEIDALPCPQSGSGTMYFDDAVKGFALRVSAKGVKTFVFQYRAGGTVRRLQIGRYVSGAEGGITPAQARKQAAAASAQVAAGQDPVADDAAAAREQSQRAAASALTLSKLVEEWAEKSLATRSAIHRKEAPAAIRRGFAKFLTRPVASLKPAELQAASEAIERRHPHHGPSPAILRPRHGELGEGARHDRSQPVRQDHH